MLSMVVSTLLALGAAAAVLVVASVAGGRNARRPAGVSTFAGDVRSGLRTWRSTRRGDARPASAPAPVDTPFEDFLAATAVQDPAYLGVDDLTETLARARQRATRGVGGLSRR